MSDILTDADHVIDVSQSIAEQVKTAQLLEAACAALCPDGTVAGQRRYARILVTADAN